MPVKSIEKGKLDNLQPIGRIVESMIDYKSIQTYLNNFSQKTQSVLQFTEEVWPDTYLAYHSNVFNRSYVVIVFDSGFAIDN